MTEVPSADVRPDRARFLRPDPGAYRLPSRYVTPRTVTLQQNAASALVRLAQNLTFLRRELASVRTLLREKANFNPNQPRDERGRWTETGAGNESDAAERNIPTDRPAAPDPQPSATILRNQVAKAAIRKLVVMGVREAANPLIGTVLNAADLVDTAREAYPYVRSYFDEPKTLEELQAAVSVREAGYDIHHIVEQTPADRDNFARSLIDAPENLVRVPTLKLWEITAWFMRGKEDYGGLSPREYLQGKDWAERVRVGRQALIDVGVLKP